MRVHASSTLLAVLLLSIDTLAADSKKEARVTQIVRDVKLMPSDAATRPASVNDRVDEETGVRTGGDSRSELTFVDFTITRLGANTIFSFNRAGHSARVESGSLLFRVPKNSGGGRITSSGVSVAVTGTTVILECTRGNRLFVMEGGARISLIKYPSQFQNLRAGQMVDVPPGAKTIPPPTNFDLNDLMRKHPLITDFPPLPSRDLIAAAAQQQSPQSGPSIFPIVPAISLFGGGLTTGSGRPPRGPRGPGQPTGPTGSSPTGGQTQPTGPGQGTGTGQPTGPGPGTGPGPSGPSRPPVSGQGTVVGPSKAQPTPPPVIYRQQPGRTVGPAATGTSKQTKPQSTSASKKRKNPTPPPSQNNEPR